MPVGSAPGRLDVLGGVADYSGALVLELPLRVSTHVTTEPNDVFEVGSIRLAPAELDGLASAPYEQIRRDLAQAPSWTRYVIGVALVLVRHGVLDPPTVRVTVASDVPQAVGVSSSAALEVAAARALLGDVRVDPLQLATLCQEAENQVVGAPCGIMDQVTVAVGAPGAILPILCRPASVEPPVSVPPDIEVVGWPTGAQHDVSGAPYRTARAAAFMGKRIVEAATGGTWAWVSELPPDAVAQLPDSVTGASFLDRWCGTDDPVTVVEADRSYPVRAATAFGVSEHARSQAALEQLRRGAVSALGPLLAESHAGYDAMGLGHPASSAVVELALDRPGVLGARSSGGGCGGTVVVVCERGALDDVDHLIR